MISNAKRPNFRGGYSLSAMTLFTLAQLTSITRAQTPDSATEFYNRGNDRLRIGDLDGAIANYGQAVTIDPHLACAYVNSGYAKQVKGEVDDAIADLDHAISINPQLAAAYFHRGNAHLAK